MRNWIYILLLAMSCLFSGCYLPIKRGGKEAICIITGSPNIYKLGNTEYYHTNAEFEVDRKKYHSGSGWEENVHKGEHYIVVYRIKNPKNNRIFYDRPVLPQGSVQKTVGTIRKYEKGQCEFAYRIVHTSHLYTKTQMLTPWSQVTYNKHKLAKKYPELKVGATFEVEYLIANPNNAVINLHRYIPADSLNIVQEKLEATVVENKW